MALVISCYICTKNKWNWKNFKVLQIKENLINISTYWYASLISVPQYHSAFLISWTISLGARGRGGTEKDEIINTDITKNIVNLITNLF